MLKYLKGGCKKDGARRFPVVPSDRTKGNGHKNETQEALSEYQETLFHCEGGQALAQVAQGGCGVSILADTQKPPEHGPGRLAVDGPA